jgi:hypothetical protein
MLLRLMKAAAAAAIAAVVMAGCAVTLAAPAAAQNTICPTAAPGDSSNKCASTAFVQDALPAVNVGCTGADATADIIAALASGNSVQLSAGNCVVSGPLSITANGQSIVGGGPGVTTITPSGNFDLFTFTGGGSGGGLRNLSIVATGMTGGNIINVNNYNRSYFNNLIVTNPYNFAIVQNLTNRTTFANSWVNNVGGAYVFEMLGPGSLTHVNVVNLDNLDVSVSATDANSPTCLLLNGYVSTIAIHHLACTMFSAPSSRGLWMENTVSGANPPQFVEAHDLEIGNPGFECIRIDAGQQHAFANGYCNGAGNDGIFIASGAAGGPNNIEFVNQRVSGSQFTAINTDGDHISLSGGEFANNSLSGAGSFPGIAVGADTVDFQWFGGYSGGNDQSYGITIASGAVGYDIFANLASNASNPFQDNNVAGATKGNICPIGGSAACAIGAILADRATGFQSWSTGGSTTVGAGIHALFNVNTASLASYTLTLPAGPVDGQELQICTAGAITAFTLSPNSGQTILTSPTTMQPGSCLQYMWRNSTGYWIRMFLSEVPPPTTTVLGGLFAQSGATANEFVQYIDNTGAQQLAQPTIGNLANIINNSLVGNSTSGLGAPSALSAPNCSGSNDALIWILNTGLNCNTNLANLTVADQTLSGGANVTPNNLGTFASGTLTTDCGKGPLQYAVNGGAFTLAAPANDGSCIIRILNNSSAGTITLSGFTDGASIGDTPDTTNTHAFAYQIFRINGVSSHYVKAYQ